VKAGKTAGAASGGSTPATVALAAAKVPFTVHLYDHDPGAASFGLEAAHALGLPAELVYKTLLVSLDGELVVGIVPVSTQLDLKAIAAVLGGKKATMAEPTRAEKATGYVVGGISPIGQRRGHRTVLDASAKAFAMILVSGGKRGMDLGIAPADLVQLTDATTAQISRRR